MKRYTHTILLLLILLVASFSVFSASISDPVVLRLVAYIPERTIFTPSDDGFFIESNAHNFSYSVEESFGTRTLSVVAR